MTYIIKIDGKIVKGFDGKPEGKANHRGWYTTANDEIGTIEYTENIEEAYKVEGRINMRSAFERISDRMSVQGLKFSSLEFVEKEI